MDYSYRNSRYKKRKIRRYRRVIAILSVVFTAGILAAGYSLVHLLTEKKEVVEEDKITSNVEATSEQDKNTSSTVRVISDIEETVKPDETESEPIEEKKELNQTEKVLASSIKDLVKFSAKNAEKYFKGAVFIGDSRTQGLQINAGIRSAKFFAGRGLNVKNALTDKVVQVNKKQLTVVEALEGGKYRKIYISFGINELGWTNLDIFIQRYKDLITEVQKKQPDAEIVVYGILPVTQKKSDKDDIFNMKNVKKFNKRIKNMAKDMEITYVDVSKAVSNKKGYLPDDVTPDGIHMNKEYCRRILAYIVNKEI